MHRRAALGLALALLAAPAAANGVVLHTDRLTWREEVAGFGSFSGLHVSADGARFTTVSDKGAFATGTLERRAGRLAGVRLDRHGPLLDPDGAPLERYEIDAEGLAMGPGGRFHVSFEAVDRIAVHTDIAAPPVLLPTPREFTALQNNSAIEALASGPDGALYAIPERSGRLDRPFPVFRYRDGAWSIPFSVPRRPPYLVVGAEFGPDGRLYVLERDHALLGFRTRIRRFAVSDTALDAEETVVESFWGEFDNLEGIAPWRDAEGRIRILCISDDNERIFQRTEFVEFTLAAD